jgi:hypothetical protein
MANYIKEKKAMVADVDSELHVGVVAFVLMRAGEVTSAK